MNGTAYLVGSGPGDPALLTLRARRLLGEADVIVRDHLVAPEILALAHAEAARFLGQERRRTLPPAARHLAACRT
jgi:uroporphyrin-III C-methyltransferase